jgi:hypothetical protein
MTNEINESMQLIVVDADGVIITYANGVITSDNPEFVKKVIEAGYYGFPPIRFFEPSGRYVNPNLDPHDLIGITAALFSARPGRTILLEAPAEVKEWFAEERANRSGCIPESPSSEELTVEEWQTKMNKALAPEEIMRRHFERWGRKDL